MYSKQTTLSLNKAIEKHFKNVVVPIEEGMKLDLSGVSKLVFLDRYSFKDLELVSLSEGDLVLLTVKDDPSFPKRGIAEVQSIDKEKNEVTVLVHEDYRIDDNPSGVMTLDKNRVDKPMELYYEQTAKRVSRGLSDKEKKGIVREKVGKQFLKILNSLKLIPAGRVLNGAGTGAQTTYFNCYVMPFIQDSREGIGEHRKTVMEIMSRGGGVGTNGSTLRPRNTLAKGVNGKSSGAVSWLNDLAKLTNLVEQGGSRRGAQMIMLASWSVDIVEFIVSKIQKPEILRYIIKKTTDESIRIAAQNKLNFKKLTPFEKEVYSSALNSEDESVVKRAKSILKDGGTYSVNQPDFFDGANISVAITDDFMEAVQKDEMYPLRFPDVENYNDEEKAFYDENWHKVGDVRKWEAMGMKVKTHRLIRAKELWNLITIAATYSAEPGIFFIDNANRETNATAYGQEVVATNPCGEQPLSPYSVCNLSAINLSEFANFVDKKLDEKSLRETVRTAVRMQDNTIDESPYFLEENKVQALGERRVGLGVMGLADLLIKLGVRYGSEEGISTVDYVMSIIKEEAYLTSIDLAVEKGSFPFLIGKTPEETKELRVKFINTGFMKRMPQFIRDEILEFGIRNSHLLTVAPTGSTGTMIGCATGLEPYYSFKYYRSGRLGKSIEVNASIVQDYYEAFPEEVGKPLPDYFVSAMELTPEEHVDMQCAIQKHIDSAISKTVNAPKGYTVEQVQKVYERLYKGGAKGGTVYVDGSRDAQVLSLEKEEDTFTEIEVSAELNDETIKTNKTNLNPVERKVGGDVGNICPVCEAGTLIDSGGCVTCSNCGVQTKCGL